MTARTLSCRSFFPNDIFLLYLRFCCIINIAGGDDIKYEKWRTKEGLTLLQGWASDGLSLEQIAHNMGIVRSTLDVYCKKFSDISDALKKGREVADYEVQNALFNRAIGCKTVTTYRSVDKETGKLVDVTQIVTEHTPDTGACMAWLKNRKPDVWRDRPASVENDISGVVEISEVDNGD